MSKPILVAAAVISALAVSACGGASRPTAAAACRQGRTVGAHFNADWAQYAAVAQTNPVGADPSHLRRDLTEMGQMVSALSHEDGNVVDQQHLARAERGLADLDAALTDLHAGNEVGALEELKHGARAIAGLSGDSRSICKGV
jgi:hypothetical protein